MLDDLPSTGVGAGGNEWDEQLQQESRAYDERFGAADPPPRAAQLPGRPEITSASAAAAAAAARGPGSGVGSGAGAGASSSELTLEAIVQDPDLVQEKLKSGIVPVIRNIVATVNLGAKLDLKKIAMGARNAEYNPKRFGAVIMRVRSPKATALVFQSGKIICTGSRSEADARLASRKIARIIQKVAEPSVRFLEFTIQNIVATADLRFPIKLEKLADEQQDTCSYEPEIFPGLIYRFPSPKKVVVLCFVSGNVIITGARDRAQIYQVFETIFQVLASYRKETPPSTALV